MQHHRQKDADNPASDLAGQIAISGRLLVATVVGACSSDPRGRGSKQNNYPSPAGASRVLFATAYWPKKSKKPVISSVPKSISHGRTTTHVHRNHHIHRDKATPLL
jgi:hypothetical protein